VRKASPALARAARASLLDIALSLSPRAAPTPVGSGSFASEAGVFLAAEGVLALFHSEQGFATALSARAEQQGLPGQVALASSCNTALLAARRIRGQPGATCVLAAGCEESFLAPLPLDLLDPGDGLAQTLTRFGVRTLGDLLRLPRRGLAQRLGGDVLQWIARARGEETEAPLPAPRSTLLEEAIDLESPLHDLEPLGFVLRGLLSRLLERLALRHLACGPLELKLALAGGRHDVRTLKLGAASLDLRGLLRGLTLALCERPPEAPVEGVSLASEGHPLRSDQLDLFRPRGPDPRALDRTLGELESLCGEGRVGTPVVGDSHHPAAFGVRPFHSRSQPSPARVYPESAQAGFSSLAIRALRPPVRAEVSSDRGQPVFVHSAISHGRVVAMAGPWRSTGFWWSDREERFAIDHFDVQVSDGKLLRLGFDWIDRVWQIDGVYD
jgi:protein ImuB